MKQTSALLSYRLPHSSRLAEGRFTSSKAFMVSLTPLFSPPLILRIPLHFTTLFLRLPLFHFHHNSTLSLSNLDNYRWCACLFSLIVLRQSPTPKSVVSVKYLSDLRVRLLSSFCSACSRMVSDWMRGSDRARNWNETFGRSQIMV